MKRGQHTKREGFGHSELLNGSRPEADSKLNRDIEHAHSHESHARAEARTRTDLAPEVVSPIVKVVHIARRANDHEPSLRSSPGAAPRR